MNMDQRRQPDNFAQGPNYVDNHLSITIRIYDNSQLGINSNVQSCTTGGHQQTPVQQLYNLLWLEKVEVAYKF